MKHNNNTGPVLYHNTSEHNNNLTVEFSIKLNNINQS